MREIIEGCGVGTREGERGRIPVPLQDGNVLLIASYLPGIHEARGVPSTRKK